MVINFEQIKKKKWVLHPQNSLKIQCIIYALDVIKKQWKNEIREQKSITDQITGVYIMGLTCH